MSSTTFIASQAVDMSKEKDWPMNLGMLDWDDTKIVFTKRSLIEFLKYTGVTVDPGFSNIQKLPRYAQFGNLAVNPDLDEATVKEPTSPTSVTQLPAVGVQRFVGEEFSDDALSTAPPRSPPGHSDNTTEASGLSKPSRRVRTTPGGTDSIGNIFSDESTQTFVPTRRVRQRPGGEDNIEGLF